MCTSLENLNDNFLTHDIVIHASGPNYNECNNINLVKKYIEETKHLIDLSILNKSVQKFIFLSSLIVFIILPLIKLLFDSITKLFLLFKICSFII